MTFTEVPIIGPAVGWHQNGRAEWERLAPRTQARAKFALLIGATWAAYHYSLGSLAQTLSSDTPLAYLGLVPVLALGLAWFNRKPSAYEPPIHDRQLDYSIGLPLIIVPLLAAYVLPARLGAMVWVNRLDLLFLPFFVAGATILLFGVRVAWRQKVALLFLLLAWPWPYTNVLLGTLGGFRDLTLHGLRFALGFVPVATPVGSANDTALFQVVHHGSAFPISIVSACSGIDSMVGFLLIGIAVASLAKGAVSRKVLWLGIGLVLLWCLNIARLLLIFWVGELAGPHIALGVLHPFAGLVFFALGMALLVVLLRPLGLQLPTGDREPDRAEPNARSATPHVFLVAVTLLAVAVLLSGGNARLRYFDPVATAAGEPKLSSYLARPATPAGWTPAFQTEYVSSKTLFGGSSRWFRYLYSPTSPAHATLHSTLPVTADVIDARGLGGFSAYGVTACYSFHGYKLHDVDAVKLGDGVTGQALSYAGGRTKQDWSIVWWIWPVRTGDGTRYERVVLSLQNTSAGKVVAPDPSVGANATTAVDRRLAVNRAFLVAFGREIVAAQRNHHDFNVKVTTVATPGAAHAAWLARRTDAQGKQLAPTANSSSTADGSSSAHDAFWRTYFLHHPGPGVAVPASTGKAPGD
jgi:exosortase/archaeosortase family protein